MAKRRIQKRRRNKEGSITKRKDGRWQVSFTVGKKPDGAPLRIYEYASSEDEARKRLIEMTYMHSRGALSTKEPIAFEELARRWLGVKAASVKRNTTASYRGMLEGHVLPVIGETRVDKIKVSTLEDLQACLLQKGLGSRTVSYAMWLTSAVLDSAVRDDLITKNPADGLHKLKLKSARPARALTAKETKAFLESAKAERLHTAFFLMLCLGLRRGEVLGLRWQDVHLEERYLDITCSLFVDPEKGYTFDVTKTPKGRRRLYLPEDAVAVLEAHKEAQERERRVAGDVWTSLGTVVTSEVGTPVHPDNLKRVMARICKRAGIAKIRIHDLRHTHASLALRSRVDDKVLSERLGHADVKFTRQIYQHTYEEQHRAAALSIAELVGDVERPSRN